MNTCLNKYRILSPVLFLLASTLFGAQGPLRGRVVDAESGRGIPLVNIVIAQSNAGASTDSQGKFSLAVAAGELLEVTHIAYEPLEFTVPPERGSIITMTLKPRLLLGEQVFVTATRGSEDRTPVAFATMDHRDLALAAPVEDLPMALAGLPGVYAFSDAGNGVGYTYLKIRGFDQDRIGVMINGIPLNDPESHQVYWVDHGDILAGSASVQVQRGVGNSLYGASAIGGSVNLVTSPRATPPGLTIKSGYGDFTGAFSRPTRKLAVQWSGQPWSGQPFTVYGRYSGIRSAGYRLGSGTKQDALHLIGEALQPDQAVKLELISGYQVTHFSWDGVIPLYGYDLGNRVARRYNYYADPANNGGRSAANKDVFFQNIASLQHAKKLAGGGILSFSVYRVSGQGYYEQFKGDRDPREYNLTALLPDTIAGVNVIRRKWLENSYWGIIPQYTVDEPWGTTVLGGDLRLYQADHYGLVREVDDFPLIDGPEYYRYATNKQSLSAYLHQLVALGPRVNMMFDLKYSYHAYTFEQDSMGAYTAPYQYQLVYQFLDPRLGLRFKFNDQVSAFVNLSRAQREPADSDIYDADDPQAVPWLLGAPGQRTGLKRPLVQAEELWDLEIGWRYESARLALTTNLYSMWFHNELVPLDYRSITDDGVPIHGNAELTIHRGIEVQFSQQLAGGLSLDGSFTMADNRFVDYSTFEWQEDSPEVNHKGRVIPGHPGTLGNLRLKWTGRRLEMWSQGRHVGKIYIDRQNTEMAAIAPSTVLDAGLVVKLGGGRMPLKSLELYFKGYNLLDTLYETFGYNYWDWDDESGPYRVDVYWPAATRGYFAGLSLRF
ncbi:MAG: TonB-dependent receptor [Candidatus Marinimicrobia bacterium]|nr:TonB-dependent receptor [Candidatus Neomarinimicrobiota bacterium]